MATKLPAQFDHSDWSTAVVAVTVTYNSADVLTEFLDSVRAQNSDWRLVVVDNCSSDATRKMLAAAAAADPRIHLILSQENTGFSAGTNIGIRAALEHNAQSILLLNNDTVFEPNLFSGLSSALSTSDAAAVSPLIVFADAPDRIWYAGGHIERRRGLHNIHEHSEEDVAVLTRQAFATEFCPACCMLFRADVFKDLGLLDEDFFVYWEDAEFCDRMIRHDAAIVVVPALRLRHKASSLTGGSTSPFYIDHYHRNRIVFLRKTASAIPAAYATMLIVAAIFRGALSGRDHWQVSRRRLRAVGRGLVAKLSPAPQASG